MRRRTRARPGCGRRARFRCSRARAAMAPTIDGAVRMDPVAGADGVERVERSSRPAPDAWLSTPESMTAISTRLPVASVMRLRHPHARQRILLEIAASSTPALGAFLQRGNVVRLQPHKPSAASARTTAGTGRRSLIRKRRIDVPVSLQIERSRAASGDAAAAARRWSAARRWARPRPPPRSARSGAQLAGGCRWIARAASTAAGRRH